MRYRSKIQMVLHGQLDSPQLGKVCFLWFNMDEELTATDHAVSRRHEPTLHFTISLRRLKLVSGEGSSQGQNQTFLLPSWAKQAALPLSFP